MTALSNEQGVIAALAIDQRGSLQKTLTGLFKRDVTAAEMSEFKSLVSEVLTPYASAILLDPEFGLDAAEHRAKGTGLLLAYEVTGYDSTAKGRFPALLPTWSALRLVEAGADAVKLLLYYDPDDDESINTTKHAFVERIGAECAAGDVPFFLEVVSYSESIGDEKGLEFARVKPDKVRRLTREFSLPRYGVDVLKLEIPVNMRYVAGTETAQDGPTAYTRDEAKQFFHDVAAESRVPFIYLSAGVTDATFLASLRLANEAGVPYAGVLCGRATWQEGVPVYVQGGAQALRAWLEDQGRRNVEALNEVLSAGARPWWKSPGTQQS